MKRVFLWLLLSTALAFIPAALAHAASRSVVIAQVQAGALSTEAAAATQEVITLYNNSDNDVDITNWCLTNKATLVIACFAPTESGQAIWLGARSATTLVSASFAAAHPDVLASNVVDKVFEPLTSLSGSITGSADTLSLIDADQQVIDRVQWATALAGGSAWQRQADPSSSQTLIDTDAVIDSTKTLDFIKQLGVVIPASGLYDVLTIIDRCPNMSGIQEVVPEGYSQGESGDCEIVVDVCPNLDGLQLLMPSGDMLDETGNCVGDMCPSLEGLQRVVPEGYIITSGECSRQPVALQLTELLANASGSDEGHEFIELYNPSDQTVNLASYALVLGVNGDKTLALPQGMSIGPGQYRPVYNSELAFSLVNTMGKVTLIGPSGDVLSQTDMYTNPADDMAWAFIDGTWQYTNQPTPGEANRTSVIAVSSVVISSSLQPCAANQYRNEETNRCRLLVTATSSVVPCKEGQYRSEETNRCRSIAAVAAGALKPCADDQFRNPATGRCKAIASSDDATLTDCGEGRERNPDTHRCRNIAAKTVPAAAFAVEPIKASAQTFVGWWALGGVGALALGYGAFEWRRELMKGLFGMGRFFTFHK